MTQSDILSDLNYVKTVAEAGQKAPLLGGRLGLCWGGLLCAALFLHWAIITGLAGLPNSYLNFLWLGFGLAGLTGAKFLGKALPAKPGYGAFSNKAAGAIWAGNTILLFLFAVSAGFSAAFGINDFSVMNVMMPLAFGLYGATAFVLSRLADQKWLMWPALAGFAFVPLTLFMLGSPHMYLVSIIGVVMTIIIPETINLRREPKAANA